MKRWAQTGVTLALLGASALAIGGVRGRLADAHRVVQETSDVYVLPPPDQVVTLSMGYRSALADLLWAHVLVSQGLHMFEKRRFENLSLLLDSINELEPTFREPYLLADALYTFQSGTPSHDEVLKARQVMERGTRERPLDGAIWLALGQFVTYIAPSSYLQDPKEQEAWRTEGAAYLARAAELTGDDPGIGWQAIAGAGVLHKKGQRDAAIAFLRRQLAALGDPEMVSDPERAQDLRELKEQVEQQLRALTGKTVEENVEDRRRQRHLRMAAIRNQELPWASATRMFVLGPPVDGARCAGPEHADDADCALSWREWAERNQLATELDEPR